MSMKKRRCHDRETARRFESDRRQGFSVPPEGQAEETAKTKAPEKGQEKWLKGVIYIIPFRKVNNGCAIRQLRIDDELYFTVKVLLAVENAQ